MNLIIKRPKQYADLFRHYTIFVNGTERGTISSGDTLNITELSGNINLTAKIDWCITSDFNINADNNETVTLIVKNNNVLANILLSISIIITTGIPFIFGDFNFLRPVGIVFAIAAFATILYRLTLGRKQYLKFIKE